jgi:CRP/FNR family transcriptional regulator, anaerobic regulatory protein
MSAVLEIRATPAPARIAVSCAQCAVRAGCLPGDAPEADMARFDSVVHVRRRVRRGESLFSAGDTFRAIYAVRSGFFKTSMVDAGAREQVTGFFMSGELLGMDGFGRGRYECSAFALEDSDVCAMPHALIEKVAREVPSLQRRLHAVLAREIVRDQGIMLLLGTMCGEERLAAFLLNLSRRLAQRGYSDSSFVLRMTREEIGSYLGLTLETVSRLFSVFHRGGFIDVRKKQVSIIDIAGLKRVLVRLA